MMKRFAYLSTILYPEDTWSFFSTGKDEKTMKRISTDRSSTAHPIKE